MLRELYIKNYALIEEMTITFSENLTVLSGETGAGKSIIVGALGLILGEKAKTSSIRSGTEYCIVEGRFYLAKGHPVARRMEELGIAEVEEVGAVIRRVISMGGTSKCYINGLQVAVKDLRDVTGILVDIHGQHEHQSLLNVKNHLFLLDQYGKLQKELGAYQQSYRKIIHLRNEIEARRMDEREKERRIDILQYSLNEIEQAHLVEEEDTELENQYRVLKHYDQLVTSVQNSYNLLRLHEDSSLTMLERALQELGGVKDFAEEMHEPVQELENAKLVIEEAAMSLKNYIDSIEYEPGLIDKIQQRLALIKNLKKKYGDSIQEIQRYGQKCRTELDELEMHDDILKDLQLELDKEYARAQQLALTLSAQRRVAAHTLEESIKSELAFLHMKKARFKVNISYKSSDEGKVLIDGKRYELAQNGLDKVEFMISTNVGEPLLPLRNVASGGELSRVMLAIKTVLGSVDPIVTFVFDEIDAGIGGKVSWAVGNRLRSLSRYKQILCVTHQAQIASKADLNLRVEKKSKDNRTVTDVKLLNSEQRIEEIARMISGAIITQAARQQAQEMINETLANIQNSG
jgi:DNA repair protein RecN (Recombination protein N)